MSTVIASVEAALPANDCPLCGKNHRAGTRVLSVCASKMIAAGYEGYDYDNETWIKKEN